MEAYRIKNPSDRISAITSGARLKFIPAPFVENADGTADGAGDHIGNFFLCMPVRPGIRCSFCNIMMEHSQHFLQTDHCHEACSRDRTEKDFPCRFLAERDTLSLTELAEQPLILSNRYRKLYALRFRTGRSVLRHLSDL